MMALNVEVGGYVTASIKIQWKTKAILHILSHCHSFLHFWASDDYPTTRKRNAWQSYIQ